MPATRPARPKPSLGKRLLLLSMALCISVVMAELLYRMLRAAPYSAPQMVTSDGQRIPTSEIANFLRTSDEGAVAKHPRGTLKPGLEFKQFYDRPTQPYFDADGCISVKVNDLGFRDLPFALAKQPDELRILTVGDSFTFGSGVQTDGTWPQQLEGMLRAERKTPVEVINGGFAAGSHEVAGYVDWIRSDGVGFQPDILIIGLCLNDLGNIPMLGYPIIKPEPWLGGISEILNTIQNSLTMREVKRHKLDGTLVLKYFPAPWEAAKEGMRAIKQIAAENKVRLIIAVFPMVTQLNENYPLTGVHQMVAEFLASEGIESVDLLAKFLGHEESDLWVHPTDQHPNHIGQRFLAEGIRDYLNAHPTNAK